MNSPATVDFSQYEESPYWKSHMELLEEMAKTWKFAIKRKEAIDKHDWDAIAAINEEQKPINERIAFLWKVDWWYHQEIVAKNKEAESFQKEIAEVGKTDAIKWINLLCWTKDPRLSELDIPTSKLRLILTKGQMQMIYEIENCFKGRIPFLVEKSRDEGATWCIAAWCVCKFFYSPGFIVLWGSCKEDKVDKKGDPNTIFDKIRYLIYNIPKALRPVDLKERDGPNDKIMGIYLPSTGSAIIGEGGDNIGRSGRASIAFIDEAQDLEHPEMVNESLSGGTTNCVGWIGTPKGMNYFGQLRHSGKVFVISRPWWLNPSKNPEWRTGLKPQDNDWYLYKCLTNDPVVVASQIDINYNASVEGTMIPAEWVNAAVDFPLRADGEIVAGFDIAGSGNNESVYIRRVGPVAFTPNVFTYSTATESEWEAIRIGEEDGISALNYDVDGIGQSMLDIQKLSEYQFRFKLVAIHGNDRASEIMIESEGKKGNEKFRNKRAEIWWGLRERFRKTFEVSKNIEKYPEHELISIPNDPLLVSQLSWPLRVTTPGGKIGVESKDAMRGRGVASPDRADALAYAFSGYDDSGYVVDKFDYTTNANVFRPFEVNFESGVYEQYVSLFQDKGMTTSVLCCMWIPNMKQNDGKRISKLRVYHEITETNALPDEIAPLVKAVTHYDVHPVKEWVANAEVFGDDWRRSPDRLYARKGIRLRKVPEYDERGAIMLLNELMKEGVLEINSSCKRLMMQLSMWRKRNNEPIEGMGLARALCLLVTRLKQMNKLERVPEKAKPYGGDIEGRRVKAMMQYLGVD